MFIFSTLGDGDEKKQARQIVRRKSWNCHASSLSANERKRNKKEKRESAWSQALQVERVGTESGAENESARRRFRQSAWVFAEAGG
jgi:hypothetical protein